ncbi:hypothetical protein [Salinicola sp. RZ23]|uniref:hypothetical protein n=1 Tax=Salinicola sp. RZ23 TaxID=1949087 RepID=UPI000DA1C54A|nr:hypothetical protein [Salinicola sp. RZ23]
MCDNDRESMIRRTQKKACHQFGRGEPVATRAPAAIPEDIRLTLVALVTERLIQMHHQPMRPGKATEFECLKPAAEWLLGQAEGAR